MEQVFSLMSVRGPIIGLLIPKFEKSCKFNVRFRMQYMKSYSIICGSSTTIVVVTLNCCWIANDSHELHLYNKFIYRDCSVVSSRFPESGASSGSEPMDP